jgi:hypothetical protein
MARYDNRVHFPGMARFHGTVLCWDMARSLSPVLSGMRARSFLMVRSLGVSRSLSLAISLTRAHCLT